MQTALVVYRKNRLICEGNSWQNYKRNPFLEEKGFANGFLGRYANVLNYCNVMGSKMYENFEVNQTTLCW